jgi:hypothetical protein
MTSKVIVSNNAAGLGDDKMLEAALGLHNQNAYMGMISETWRSGCVLEKKEVGNHGWLFVGFGTEKPGAFGSRRGVGVGQVGRLRSAS